MPRLPRMGRRNSEGILNSRSAGRERGKEGGGESVVIDRRGRDDEGGPEGVVVLKREEGEEGIDTKTRGSLRRGIKTGKAECWRGIH